MKYFKALIMSIILLLLFGCISHIKEAPETSEKEQQQIVKMLVEMLEKEYHQPFKVIKFKYNYTGHTSGANDCAFIYCRSHVYGEYYLDIQAVDNPFITINLSLNDGGGIKNMLKQFREKDLSKVYCYAFSELFNKNYINEKWVYPKEQHIDKKKFYETADFCDQRPSKYDISRKEVDELTNFAIYLPGGRTNWTIQFENTPKSINNFLKNMYHITQKWDIQGDTIGVTLFSLIDSGNTVTVHPEGSFLVGDYWAKKAKSPEDLKEYLYLRTEN
ncbi:hypothetical protein ACFPDQ_06610 [Pseudofrancisella aestuarii]|uniref:Lipoprotein n=1 Tax=Pseudofrancisella aestuarii TaxID=2670347 RepID=A0ABV9TDF5_9GAMM|nr:hypothetical protein [Pseudofrancisella aestuarii]